MYSDNLGSAHPGLLGLCQTGVFKRRGCLGNGFLSPSVLAYSELVNPEETTEVMRQLLQLPPLYCF